MGNHGLSFRDLIAPVPGEQFFAENYRQKPLHIPGPEDKFADIFSWEEVNDLLRMTTLWTDKTCGLSMNGRRIPPQDYCYEGPNRDNVRSWKPEFAKLRAHMRDGATLSLDFIERLTPALQSISCSFSAVMSAPVNCTALVSWHSTQGYAAHFDTTNVFALQIAGRKRWNIYERRLPNAAHTPGARNHDYPQEHHDRVKGAIQQQIEMTPGDFLYLPHGQYHDAMTEDDYSLHLSFAVRHLVGQDFVDLLMRDLHQDPSFRLHLPQYDDLTSHETYRHKFATRLQEIIVDPKVGQELRHYLEQRAFELVGDFDLPSREDPKLFRVCWLGRRLARQGDHWRINGMGGEIELDQTEGAFADWAFRKDFFSAKELAEEFADLDPKQLDSAMDRLLQIGLVQPI